jgi:hypothetical protein
LLKPEDLQAYQMSMKFGEDVWQIVNNWDYFAKDTLGKQLLNQELIRNHSSKSEE